MAGVSPAAAETVLILALWTALAALHPRFLVTVYLPGYLLGLALCSLQGHYEHARGALSHKDVVSHYGALYNFLCLNDGYHAEHHADPAAHWTALPEWIDPAARVSRWPAPLRWLDDISLEALERLVLRSPRLRSFVLSSHRRALQALLPRVSCAVRVAIVGGGLFPRTALLLQELLPAASLTIVDADAANLATARKLIRGVEFVHARYVVGSVQGEMSGYDLVVIPLSFDGSRAALERHPPARAVLVHDWIWRRRGQSRIVSLALLKRINLIQIR